MLGLIGILVNAIGSELNNQVAVAAIADLRGGLRISHDPSTWFESLYTSAEIFGMGVSPWFLVTLTLRRWTLFVVILCGLSTVLIPFSPDLAMLYTLRILQGLGGGLSIPLLLTAALKVLKPDVRLYGLALYALTATFTPAVATPLAALWTSLVGWHWVFWQALPFCAVAGALVWAGVPPEQPKLDRFRRMDWRGMLLLALLAGALGTLLYHGDRLDWFNSQLICVLALICSVALPLLLVNEWFHDLPILKLQLLRRSNFAFANVALFLFLLIGLSASAVPSRFLTNVRGFRPEQIAPLSAVIAVSQLLLLPAVAWVLDHRRMDARLVLLLGLVLIMAACTGDSRVAPVWFPLQFYVWQVLQAVGQPMVVVSLLMLGTNDITEPEDGPFASALVNVQRGTAEATGVWLLNLINRWRGGLHYNRIVDQLGQDQVPLTGTVADAVRRQVTTLTISDTYLVLACLTLALMAVLAAMTRRTLPPRIVMTKHSE